VCWQVCVVDGQGKLSLEGWRKSKKVTKCEGGGDVMCCLIGSEMWLCMRREHERKSIYALHLRLQFIFHFPSHQVSIWKRVHSVPFSALSMSWIIVVYALSTAQGTCSTNAQLSSAISRMTFGASVVCARSRIKRCCNDSWAGSHVVPRILHWIATEEVEKV
jgi:hypothetical protein